MSRTNPTIALLSDSKPLFTEAMQSFLQGHDSAAYLGASNNDDVTFYDLFRGAMENGGVKQYCHVHRQPSGDEVKFLAKASIIVLAGGDPELGWSTISRGNIIQAILKRYKEGALVIGVSAGALHIGKGYWNGQKLRTTLQLAPAFIGIHGENNGWEDLKKALLLYGKPCSGWGLAPGTMLLYQVNSGLKVISGTAHEFSTKDGRHINYNLLISNPGQHHA